MKIMSLAKKHRMRPADVVNAQTRRIHVCDTFMCTNSENTGAAIRTKRKNGNFCINCSAWNIRPVIWTSYEDNYVTIIMAWLNLWQKKLTNDLHTTGDCGHRPWCFFSLGAEIDQQTCKWKLLFSENSNTLFDVFQIQQQLKEQLERILHIFLLWTHRWRCCP